MTTKTLLQNKDYKLLKDHIYIISRAKYAGNNEWGMCDFTGDITKELNGKYRYLVTNTTNPSLQGVKQLDRNLFVKKEDVEELYHQTKYNLGYDSYDLHDEYFHAGYNANKNEFSRKDMEIAIERAGYMAQMGISCEKATKSILTELRPLTLPQSITVDSEYNVIKINF